MRHVLDELGAVATAREQVFDIFVERPWPDADVNALVDQRIQSIIEAVGANAYEVYLTGPGNYRDWVATLRPYKGQRVGLQKPYHWETVSRRLKEHWGAVTFNGIEADDWLGVRGRYRGGFKLHCLFPRQRTYGRYLTVITTVGLVVRTSLS